MSEVTSNPEQMERKWSVEVATSPVAHSESDYCLDGAAVEDALTALGMPNVKANIFISAWLSIDTPITHPRKYPSDAKEGQTDTPLDTDVQQLLRRAEMPDSSQTDVFYLNVLPTVQKVDDNDPGRSIGRGEIEQNTVARLNTSAMEQLLKIVDHYKRLHDIPNETQNDQVWSKFHDPILWAAKAIGVGALAVSIFGSAKKLPVNSRALKVLIPSAAAVPALKLGYKPLKDFVNGKVKKESDIQLRFSEERWKRINDAAQKITVLTLNMDKFFEVKPTRYYGDSYPVELMDKALASA